MIRSRPLVLVAAAAAALVVAACKRSPEGGPPPTSALPDRYWLPQAPAGAMQAAEVRAHAKSGEQIVVTGVVGGRKQPFTEGAAAFTIVDDAAKKCTPGECETPWDYCCTPPDQLSASTVVVEFHENGHPIRQGARGYHGLDHMKTVVVAGEARRDDAGNVTVVATGIHVKP
jgi:hypothetical protein